MRAADLTGEVIVPSYTFVATVHAVQWLGLTPVFADIDPATHTIDADQVEALVTDRTSAILGVHLWGRSAPVAKLTEIAEAHGLRLLFDAAHAFGCSSEGRPIGGNGDAEIFSFHATKFFNTFEGGAVATDDDELAARIRLMRNFGFAGVDRVVSTGINAKMSEMAAAMGLVNLEAVPAIVTHNRANHEAYRAGIDRLPGVSLLEFDVAEASNFQYVVMEVHPEAGVGRDAVLAHLHSHGVLARRYFWPGVHRMEPYASDPRYAGLALPATEEVADRVVVLPTGQHVSALEVDRVVALVGEALADSSP